MRTTHRATSTGCWPGSKESEMRSIKAAMVLDPSSTFQYGYDPEKEAHGNAEQLQSELSLRVDLVAWGPDILAVEGKKIDVLLLDYGGLSDMGAWDVAEYNVRKVC